MVSVALFHFVAGMILCLVNILLSNAWMMTQQTICCSCSSSSSRRYNVGVRDDGSTIIFSTKRRRSILFGRQQRTAFQHSMIRRLVELQQTTDEAVDGGVSSSDDDGSSSNNNNNNNNAVEQDESSESAAAAVRFEDLMEMDVVIYSEKYDNENKRYLGAVQENGKVTPMCVWTMEPAFDNSLEFLVDEHDLIPGYDAESDITIHSIVPQNVLSYGSRQVGGGMGPGNPHGEESELLYYIDQEILLDDDNIEIIVKPELEIFW